MDKHPLDVLMEWIAGMFGGMNPKDIEEIHWKKNGGSDNRSKLDIRTSPRAEDVEIRVVSDFDF